jgi:DNA-directed RNA polymerase I subunit RPA2
MRAAVSLLFHRSVHRGSYFAELRTTTVRKLLPESWGFLCPVHTPDGSPCGLLNHFTAACCIVTHGPQQPQQMEDNLVQVGGLTVQGCSQERV